MTVIEARDRVSGRVITFDNFVPGRFVEGGGELIGSNHPAWAAYAKKFGLDFLDVPDTGAEGPVVIDGKPATNSPAIWRGRSNRASQSPGAWPSATTSPSSAADKFARFLHVQLRDLGLMIGENI